ncbi:hypothetical protein ACPOL_3800 [Acidisarcina polymorpha]|uniref:Uncharacterized protein n=1 Tax=Acidisarcina polymorpha TaxID=2211140 RepID=A0A2Z5G1W8_9BACT|nr:hypothetical protein [Acidisarcina polymorpha]AXC13079.1 hypothetical protein ACPOL_3800 [Acidisarcina polymorpha]
MSYLPGVSLLATAEPILLALTLCAFLKAGIYKRFPWFGAYLGFRLSIYAVLNLLLYSARGRFLEDHIAYNAYYYIYWVGYLAQAAVSFLVIQEVFRHLMDPLPGLGKLGLIAFRWVTLSSVLIAGVLAVFPVASGRDLLLSAASSVMRCVSVLELCLLAFIVLSMETLQISLRSQDFGVALGLGMVAASELVNSAVNLGPSSFALATSYACNIFLALAAVVWIAYFLKLGAAAKPAALPVGSPLLRWNEIAGALGHPPPHVALGSSSEFFLHDVEKAVDKVLEKNSMNPAR